MSSDTPATPAAPAETPSTTTPADCARQLAQLFPALFGGPPKPLKLRIQADIQERAPGQFSKAVLSAFFRRLTGGTSYLVAISKNDPNRIFIRTDAYQDINGVDTVREVGIYDVDAIVRRSRPLQETVDAHPAAGENG